MTTHRALAVVVGVFACAALAGSCSDDSADDESQTSIRVLDSAYTQSWAAVEDTGMLYRIEVVSPLGADTVRQVIPPGPIAVGDSLVIGLIQVSEDSSAPQRQIFWLRLAEHRVETRPLPVDVWPFYQDVLVSPDGRYLAYVGEDTNPAHPGTFGIVRNLATGAAVVKGPADGGCDCDDDLNHARWFPPDSFEIAVSLAATARGWQRLSGKASARRVHVDTLRTEPDWH